MEKRAGIRQSPPPHIAASARSGATSEALRPGTGAGPAGLGEEAATAAVMEQIAAPQEGLRNETRDIDLRRAPTAGPEAPKDELPQRQPRAAEMATAKGQTGEQPAGERSPNTDVNGERWSKRRQPLEGTAAHDEDVRKQKASEARSKFHEGRSKQPAEETDPAEALETARQKDLADRPGMVGQFSPQNPAWQPCADAASSAAGEPGGNVMASMNSAGNRLSSSQTALETLAAELENSSRQNQLLISQILQLVTEEHGHAEENARQIETLRQQIQQSRNSQGGQG